MPHIMFSAIGSLLGAAFIAIAMYYVSAQATDERASVAQPPGILIAAQPIGVTTTRQ